MCLAVFFVFTSPEQTELTIYLVELLAALRTGSRFAGSSGFASRHVGFAVLVREGRPAVRIAGASPEITFRTFAASHWLAAFRASWQVTVGL